MSHLRSAQLREALLRVSPQHPLQKKIAAAEQHLQATAQRVPAPQNAVGTAKERFERTLLRAMFNGLGALHPVTFLAWRSGQPAIVRGQPCRVRSGLSNGTDNLVVVRYDSVQPLAGTAETTPLGIEFLADLQPCPCGGYLHPRACRPQ